MREVAVIGALLACCGLSARAEPPDAPLAAHGVESLVYRAPPECPNRSEFLRLVAQELAPGGATTHAAAARRRRLQVELRPQDMRVSAELTLRDTGGTRARRHLEASDCPAAARALALVLALTLDPGLAADAAPTPLDDKPDAGPAAEQAAGRRGAGGPRPRGASLPDPGPRDPAAATEPIHQAETAPDPGPEAAPDAPEDEPPAGPATSTKPSQDAPTPGGERPPPPPEPTPLPAPRWRWMALAGPGVVWGVQPSVRPALGLSALAARPLSVPLDVWLRLGLRAALPDTLSGAQGRARFAWWTGHVSSCAAYRPRSGLRLGACLEAELGQLIASGDDTENPARTSRPWAALGPGVALLWQPTGSWFVWVAGSALWPARPDRYTLGEEIVHRIEMPGTRLELGLGTAFR